MAGLIPEAPVTGDPDRDAKVAENWPEIARSLRIALIVVPLAVVGVMAAGMVFAPLEVVLWLLPLHIVVMSCPPLIALLWFQGFGVHRVDEWRKASRGIDAQLWLHGCQIFLAIAAIDGAWVSTCFLVLLVGIGLRGLSESHLFRARLRAVPRYLPGDVRPPRTPPDRTLPVGRVELATVTGDGVYDIVLDTDRIEVTGRGADTSPLAAIPLRDIRRIETATYEDDNPRYCCYVAADGRALFGDRPRAVVLRAGAHGVLRIPTADADHTVNLIRNRRG